MIYIGDVHGDRRDKKTKQLHIDKYLEICKGLGDKPSVQVGDLGYGFLSVQKTDELDTWFFNNPQHRFIRGNHDSPRLAAKSTGYIDDGTFFKTTKTMFIGGAESSDKLMRTEGVTWWSDEQTSYERYTEILSEDHKPNIMVTHDVPLAVAGLVLGTGALPNLTRNALTYVFEQHQPDVWIFGHYHRSLRMKVGKTEFICLGELEVLEL